MDDIHTDPRSSGQVDESKKYVSTQIPSYAWGETIRKIQKRNRRKENQVEELRQSNFTENYLELMENRLSSKWNIFPGLTSLEILQKIQKDLARSKH